jgi:hypothetical protein
LKVSSFLATGGFKKEARHVVSLAAIKVWLNNRVYNIKAT